MYAVGRLGSYISRGVVHASGPFHPFGGAVDIIVVEQQDGSFKSSAWNVKFGKFQGVLKTKEKVVNINVNGEDASFHMYLDHKGEAYFLREVDAEEGEAVLYPSSSSDETDEQCRENGQPLKSMSCNYDAENLTPVGQIETPNGKILSRTNSRRSRILGLFGSRSMKERKSKEEEGVDSGVSRVDSLEGVEFAANLLEVNWSTSLAIKKPGKDNASPFLSPNMLVNEDMQIDAEQSQLSLSLPVSRVSSDVDESIIAATEHDGNAMAVISNATASDPEIQSLVELEACPGKHLDEKDVVLPGCGISHTAGGIDRVQPFIYCETLYIAREGSEQVHAETVHARTELLSKDSVTEQHADDTSVEVQSVEAPEICLQETDTHSCTDRNASLEGPAIVQPCNSQTVQQNSLPDSVQKVESQSMSSLNTSCDQVQEEENIEEEDVASCDLQTPYKSVNGHVVTEAASVLPVRLEEEQFLFSDDEIRVTEVQCMESHFPSCVGGENCLSCSPKDSTNYESYPSLEKFIPEDPSTDFQKSTGKLKAASAAVGIPRNHMAAAGKEVGRLVESLPIMWPQTDKLTAFDVHYPLSHSLDSNVHPLKSIWQCKDDLSFRKFDREEEQQLALETPDSENAPGSAELKDGPASPAVGEKLGYFLEIYPKQMLPPVEVGNSGLSADVNGSKSPEAENASESTVGTDGDKNMLTPKGMKRMERALAPMSEQLASLKLKEGKNTVTFTFFTAMLGKQQVDARIYLWKWNTRIVISDVDGTITKSDVLGQFMPLVGVDWSHVGVTHLFSAIKDGKALPDGPVVISPDGLFPSLFREVIRRAPHEFKIACLEDIKSLFPSDCNPFYAGFGNRDTDEFSYLKVGIPKGKIFIINPQGEVAVNRRVDTKSYSSLHALVNGMFPSTNSSEQEDFNTWNFWKLPLPDINV
ncbi:hypothetical protein DVH24_012442 [Malus domestica]|uniref:LNS2/PITP domain-containing protein n=1 Tax=Malus domestica TaxID=3750 RepID=A0A498HMM7_MALDO|nr:hypothetical protein DVH24_012442 [Malus domestica]